MRDLSPLDKKPLEGLRVIDLTRVLSGPFCTMMLGDMGAEVIKVETERGDATREQGTLRDGFSWYYASFNRNKKSIVLDLRCEEGRSVLAKLIASADVLVDNFRPGVLAQMGFDKERLREINPRLVTANVNGFGSCGPYVDRPAFDFIAQAMSGLMSVNGYDQGEPLRSAQPITDLVAGLYLAFGITAALRARDINGHGQHVEAVMVNGAISMMAYLASEYFVTGKLPERTGNDHPLVAPYGLFRASDGEIAIAPSNDVILRRFLSAIGIEHLMDDPCYDTNEKRFARRSELHELIDTRIASGTQESWIARLNTAGVPCGRVQALDEVFADPQVLAQEMTIDVEHPGHGLVRMLGFPLKLHGTPCQIRLPAPELGEHTDEVLASVGLTTDEISALKERRVAGAVPMNCGPVNPSAVIAGPVSVQDR